MKPTIQPYFKEEIYRAKSAIAKQDFEAAWTALQRAHILSQKDAIAHTIAHWQMLKLAWKQRDVQEIKAQILPTLLAFPLTVLFGQVRRLRGGKAGVSQPEKFSIPDDIQQILDQNS